MPCNHKFIEYLNLERLDFEPTTLIVGTFNPLIEGNKAEWFYGRFDNNFWDVLPRLYGENSMRCCKPNEWRKFCKRHKIAITDLITCIQDADLLNVSHVAMLKTYSDKTIAEKFKHHTKNNILELLKAKQTIKNVYLTRGIGENFWKKLWKPTKEYSKQFKLNENTLLTPSGYAFYQQGKYNKLNPLEPLDLEDFILKEWKSKWHKIN
jgi:G:T/U-mismatch repair DNA glycosylase